ncbi:MAG: tRNA uridine-5-carboxymethylaminomethyl(34) synthesis GTPase MnmE [candidate division FCPU426 bacterium]
MNPNDTIAAIATPPGEGGVGVIRISGPEAVAVASRFFRAADGVALEAQGLRVMALGNWVDPKGSGRVLDEVLCVRFKAPHSFTGEDVVEVHAHGGAFHLRSLLAGLLKEGLRLARPGEFSQRAFVNGRMDLTKAEAVADLIRSSTELARDAAARQLAGGLFDKVEALRLSLLDLSARTEAAVDFPEEEAQMIPTPEMLGLLRETRDEVRAMLSTARSGRLLASGIRVVLVGAPNAGKSSLMNALLQAERSIVTAQPGTTRDYIEERFSIEGFPVILTDTAGLREAADEAEAEGVLRARARMKDADVVLMLVDPTAPYHAADLTRFEKDLSGALLWVLSKKDLEPAWEISAFQKNLSGATLLHVSSKTGEGLEALKQAVLDKALGGGALNLLDSVALTSSRHEEAMRAVEAALSHAEATLQRADFSAELLAPDLRDALDHLGEIVGKTSREDVLNAIFSKFCIGK